MPLPKPIPKPVFQFYALVLLAVAWGGAVLVAVRGDPPMPALSPYLGELLAGFVVWVIASLLWMAAVIPVRLVTSGFATYEEALPATGGRTLGEAVALERARLEREGLGTPAQRLRHHLLFAGVGTVLALVLGFGAAANLELLPERVYLVFPVGAVASAGIAAVFAVRAASIWARR